MTDRITIAFGFGFAIAALFNSILVIAKESLPGLLEWMTALTGHHWVTHSILAMAVFLLSGGALLLFKPRATARALAFGIVGSTILSAGVISGYFLVH